MQATYFLRRKWTAFSLPAFFALALYAQNPAQAIRGGNGVMLPPPPATPAHPVTDEYQRHADHRSLSLARGREEPANAGLDRRAE